MGIEEILELKSEEQKEQILRAVLNGVNLCYVYVNPSIFADSSSRGVPEEMKAVSFQRFSNPKDHVEKLYHNSYDKRNYLYRYRRNTKFVPCILRALWNISNKEWKLEGQARELDHMNPTVQSYLRGMGLISTVGLKVTGQVFFVDEQTYKNLHAISIPLPE